jgi:hypothetical protein
VVTIRLCDELRWLRGRYDEGAIAPCVYSVIKAIEVEIAWRERAKRWGYGHVATRSF